MIYNPLQQRRQVLLLDLHKREERVTMFDVGIVQQRPSPQNIKPLASCKTTCIAEYGLLRAEELGTFASAAYVSPTSNNPSWNRCSTMICTHWGAIKALDCQQLEQLRLTKGDKRTLSTSLGLSSHSATTALEISNVKCLSTTCKQNAAVFGAAAVLGNSASQQKQAPWRGAHLAKLGDRAMKRHKFSILMVHSRVSSKTTLNRAHCFCHIGIAG